jgi:hypothetical protein
MDTKNEEISTRSRDLRNSTCGEIRYHRSGGKITPTTSILDGSNVYGREKDIEVVLGWLLKGEAAINGRVFVVAIGGKEGVGKTTLAQLVYNDDTVVTAFDLRAWVFDNSKDFDVVSITRTILLSVTDACNFSDNLDLLQVKLRESNNLDLLQVKLRESNNLDLLQVKLREKLSGKSCLIVLDHVCDLDSERWDLLCQPFAGSEVKIVVTTRNNSVPPIMAAMISTHQLEVLSDVDCLSMLVDHAKAKSKFDTDPKLQAIMEKIARKCKGLPRAAKHFGGRLLSTQYTEWEKI